MIRAVRGYGLVKAGELGKGLAELDEAVAWFERSRLHYTRSLFALWLAEGHLALGQRADARAVLDTVLATTREKGYRHLEGVAERLQAEALGPSDSEALAHLVRATSLLEQVGARNDLAKVLVVRAGFCRAAGDCAGARATLEQALAIFTALGTVDGPRIVASLLQSLPDGVRNSSVDSACSPE
jgi:tetratricopeptide (TPR) repeat protein